MNNTGTVSIIVNYSKGISGLTDMRRAFIFHSDCLYKVFQSHKKVMNEAALEQHLWSSVL